MKMKYDIRFKYLMRDWDSQRMSVIPRANIVDAINYARNYEFDVYLRETKELIFMCMSRNNEANKLLKPYGLEIIDSDGCRKLKSLDSGEIFTASWQ